MKSQEQFALENTIQTYFTDIYLRQYTKIKLNSDAQFTFAATDEDAYKLAVPVYFIKSMNSSTYTGQILARMCVPDSTARNLMNNNPLTLVSFFNLLHNLLNEVAEYVDFDNCKTVSFNNPIGEANVIKLDNDSGYEIRLYVQT